MKTILTRLLAIFILTVTIASCSKDNEEVAPSLLIGKWTQINMVTTVPGFPPITEPYNDNVAGCNKNYTEFIAGGAAKNVEYDKVNNVCTPFVENGTWSQNGNVLTLNDGTETYTATLVSATATELKFSKVVTRMGITGTIVFTFARV